MPHTPAHISQALNVADMPIIESVPMDINVKDPMAKAMAAAQEQLHVAMEAQAQDQKRREFAERYWQLQKVESQETRSSDREAAMEACSTAVVVVEVQINHVSLQNFMAFVLGVDLVFQLCNLERALLTPERLLAPFPGEGKTVSDSFIGHHCMELKSEIGSG